MTNLPVTATAPGKLLLLGEYAVLEGCPALSIAVNRRAAVTVRQTDATQNTLETSLLPDTTLEFSIRDDEILWSDKKAADQLKLNELLAPWNDVLGDINAPALHIALDTARFYEGVSSTVLKLGLGSSASLRVACAGVFGKLSGKIPAVPALITAHQEGQGGAGSGVDIATALHGGLIRFQRVGESADPDVQKLTLPTSFYYAAVWSGESASTSSMLKKFNRWSGRNSDQWQMCLLTARVICDAACRAISESDSTALVRTIRGYGEWMKALEKASGLRIYTPAHGFLDTMANQCGCSYKPSGAGGGDIGIVVSDCSDKFNSFQQCIAAEGYKILDLETDQNGLQISG